MVLCVWPQPQLPRAAPSPSPGCSLLDARSIHIAGCRKLSLPYASAHSCLPAGGGHAGQEVPRARPLPRLHAAGQSASHGLQHSAGLQNGVVTIGWLIEWVVTIGLRSKSACGHHKG